MGTKLMKIKHLLVMSTSSVMILLSHLAIATTPVAEHVTVTGGEIAGIVSEGGLKAYLGVPYGAPPVGALRWAPTAPVEPWAGVRGAKTTGNSCIQASGMNHFYDSDIENMSEDCLFLNIWTRAETAEEKIPVMVWVHGGAFVQGTGGDWDGTNLAAKGVIVVTINYRLGPFGFFAHPALTTENLGRGSGNQAFFDQIAALYWVKDNIQKFGGDPDNVTIFGESAGSWSMSVLQASPLARGLFHKVIGESGGRFLPMWHRNRATSYAPSAESYGEKLAELFSANKASSLQALREIPANTIMTAYQNDPSVLANFDSMAIVDGQILTEEVDVIFSKGLQADVPVLIGSNEDEALTFAPDTVDPTSAVKQDYKALFADLTRWLLPEAGDRLYELYPVNNQAQARQSWIDFHTDVVFSQPMVVWANKMANVRSNAYLYWWNWHPSINGSTDYKAFHTAELDYVFGNFGESSGYNFNIDDSPRERQFSKFMMDIWTNFAKTGNPSVAGVIDWPAYNPERPAQMVLGPEVYLSGPIRSEKIEFVTEAYEIRRAGDGKEIMID